MLPPRPPPPQHSHPCLSPTYTRSVFEGILEFLHPSIWGTRSYRCYLFFLSLFSDNFFLHFSRFSDQLLLRKRFLRKNVVQKRVFLTHKGGSYGNKILYKNLNFFDKIFVPSKILQRSLWGKHIIDGEMFCLGMVSTNLYKCYES